jgi:hypothetical protein
MELKPLLEAQLLLAAIFLLGTRSLPPPQSFTT